MQQVHRFTLKAVVGCMAWLLMVASPVATAVPVKGLYTARAEVADQASSTRKDALPAMMQEVVGRLVGEPDSRQLLSRWPELAAEFRAADRYLAQFLYQRVSGPGGVAGLVLRAEFEPAALNRLVEQYQLPQWGADRPEILVVVAWQGDGRRDVLSSSPASQLEAELTAAVEQAASKAGLPVALPLMDLQDQRHMSEQELRAGFTDGLLDVAGRYGADAVLFGRAKLFAAPQAEEGELAAPSFASRGAEFKWSLIQSGQAQRHADGFSSVEAGLQAGFGMALKVLAERYSVQGNRGLDPVAGNLPNVATVNVLGVNDLVALKRVEKHLRARTVVSNASLQQTRLLAGERLAVFQLQLQGSVEKLEQALAVGRLLEPTFKPSQTQAVADPLSNSAEQVIEVEPILEPQNPDVPSLWYRLR